MFKFENIKTKLAGALKSAGAVFADDKTADAVVAAIEALVPAGELSTENEVDAKVDDKIHETREEAKAARELSEGLMETITGMRKDDFDAKDRRKKMLDKTNEELKILQGHKKEFDEQTAPLKAEVETLRAEKAEKVKKQYVSTSEALVKIFSDEKNERFKTRFAFPEDGKELSVEDMDKNTATVKQLREDGVPAFADAKPPKTDETPTPGGGGEERDWSDLTREELAKERAQ